MEDLPPESDRNTRYFVMTKSSDVWIKVSRDYLKKHDALRALERLRREYPFARLGGARLT